MQFVDTNVFFEDALIVAPMERLKITDLSSYDRGFDQVEGVVRHEPTAGRETFGVKE